MPTKVFISWSGELSRKLGGALRDWLPSVLQHVKPYFSPEDIEKGAKWNSEIAKELEASSVGVICLTQDNTDKPWILFEAGALSKSMDKARVCTLLFNLEPTDIKGPLTSFQSTRFNMEDFKRLVTTINSNAGDAKLEGPFLDSAFTVWWPKLEAQVADIIKNHVRGEKKDRRSERDILEEILQLSRMKASNPACSASSINTRTIINLVGDFRALVDVLENRGFSDLNLQILGRLERDLHQLCVESGVSGLFENRSSYSHKFKGLFDDVRIFSAEPVIRSAEQSKDGD